MQKKIIILLLAAWAFLLSAEAKRPNILFIFESRETGEQEVGPNGDPLPIFDLDLHQYACMNTLRDNLASEIQGLGGFVTLRVHDAQWRYDRLCLCI